MTILNSILIDFYRHLTVIFKFLHDTLYAYGILGTLYTWLISYLTQKRKYVEINGAKSSNKLIEYGVPQGTILSFLVLILINILYK